MRTCRNVLWAFMLATATAVPAGLLAEPASPAHQEKPGHQEKPAHQEKSAADRAADREAMNYYPDRAFRQQVQGAARLICARDEHGAYKHCTLTEEFPKDYSFGAAALRLMKDSKGRPDLTLPPVEAETVTVVFCVWPQSITPNPLRLPRAITMPDWRTRPSAEQIKAVYPPAALAANLSGRAIVKCEVGVDGGLSGCSVVQETPPDQGFGQAALKLTASMVMKPMTVDGVPQPGALVRLPVVFGDNPPPRVPLPDLAPPEPKPQKTLAQICAANGG